MATQWIGVIGAVAGAIVGGAASLSATWLQQRSQMKVREEAAEAAMRAVILKGALCLLPNIYRVLGVLGEIEDHYWQTNVRHRLDTATSLAPLLADPLPSLPSEALVVYAQYFEILAQLSAASTSVAELRALLDGESLKGWAAANAGKTKSEFLKGLIKIHMEAIFVLRDDNRFGVLSAYWSEEVVDLCCELCEIDGQVFH